MAGTHIGGKQAAVSNRKKYGSDFYKRIGAIGGSKSRGGGFAATIDCTCDLMVGVHTVRQCAGKKGGQISRRSK